MLMADVSFDNVLLQNSEFVDIPSGVTISKIQLPMSHTRSVTLTRMKLKL